MNTLGARSIHLSLVCYLASALILMPHLPWLLVLVGGACGWWRLRVVQGLASLPKPRWVKLILLLMVLLTLWLSYSMDLFDKLVNVVMLGYSLKYIELHQRRDLEVFVLTGFFLASFSLVFSSQPLAAVLALLVCFIHLLLLLSLDVRLSFKQGKMLGLWLLAMSPLAVALFVLTPRLAPLWKMPRPDTAQTGLSEVVRPGDISQLIRSDKLAFRAEFSQAQISTSLYWRAMVLDQFDGEQWTRSALAKQIVEPPDAPLTTLPSYQLLLEPASNNWLATLHPSVLNGSGAQFQADGSWLRSGDSFARQLLRFGQLSDAELQPLPQAEQRRLSTLPQGIPDAVSRLASQFSAQATAQSSVVRTEQAIAAMQQWFLAQAFVYTLNPPAYPAWLGVEEFLLRQQRGFCVHYAQSAVVLARLMGIPARMVTGYLGGEWQQPGLRISVRHYDAHAWAEYWNGQRWLRLDPTAWIAPDRLEFNLQQSPSTAAQWQNIHSWGQRLWYSQGLNQLRLLMAQADFWWATWVLNFDQTRQLSLFSRLLKRLPGSSLWMLTTSLLLLGILLSAVALAKPWRWRLPPAELRALRWQLYLLERHDIHRRSGETLDQFVARVELESPKHLAALRQTVRAYQQRRYLE
ncbi:MULTISPECIES: transglutaminase TgpA family protein [unclassified Agarivorans]|uniref:transglutaminase TgpA family protein n=1 Tax=unclassified Agarivorans TaxID=2636026 RepID=UPI003D7CB160